MFLEKIKQNCISYKDQIAYISGDEKITYGDLWEKAKNLALFLKKDGNSPVIIYGNKSPYMIVCMLACIIAKRSYIPCDTYMPELRIRRFCSETNAGLILATEDISFFFLPVIEIKQIAQICNNSTSYDIVSTDYYPGNIVYIMFTSGSTGAPKGIPITIENLDNFLNWASSIPEIKSIKSGVVLNQASFSFDLSVADIYLSLLLGNTLFAVTKEDINDYKKLFECLKQSNCDMMVCTPSFLKMCLADTMFDSLLLPYLRTIFVCGEVFSPKICGRARKRFPDVNILNAYGPTEACCAVTCVKITDEMLKERSLPIGIIKRSAVEVTIKNEKGEVADKEQAGEIILCGKSVFDGYLFSGDDTVQPYKSNGKNCYLTGDFGYIKNGLLYFSGRKDAMIKFKGYRIEIAEVEMAINEIPLIEDSAVIPVYDESGCVTGLSAFIVSNYAEHNKNYLTKKLEYVLPEYMIPKRIVYIKKLPLNSNGKCDRIALSNMLIQKSDVTI